MSPFTFRPLEKARAMLESAGLDISYAYDDLLFIENRPFILQFDDSDQSNLFIHFEKDIISSECIQMQNKLTKVAKFYDMRITLSSRYQLTPKEEKEEFEIAFIE
jgi:hypothetical protein